MSYKVTKLLILQLETMLTAFTQYYFQNRFLTSKNYSSQWQALHMQLSPTLSQEATIHTNSPLHFQYQNEMRNVRQKKNPPKYKRLRSKEHVYKWTIIKLNKWLNLHINSFFLLLTPFLTSDSGNIMLHQYL